MNCVRMLITSLSLVVAKEELEEEAIVSFRWMYRMAGGERAFTDEQPPLRVRGRKTTIIHGQSVVVTIQK